MQEIERHRSGCNSRHCTDRYEGPITHAIARMGTKVPACSEQELIAGVDRPLLGVDPPALREYCVIELSSASIAADAI